MAKERLKEIIAEKSLQIGEFILASGAISNYIFDIKMTMLNPEGANLASDLLIQKIINDNPTAIGGLELGACPIVSSLCVKFFPDHADLKTFYVRKENKKRGTNRLIEGCTLTSEDRVIIVEDVTTTGGSAMNAVKVIQEIGGKVIKIVSVIDRLEGARDSFAKENIDFESLYTKDDFPHIN